MKRRAEFENQPAKYGVVWTSKFCKKFDQKYRSKIEFLLYGIDLASNTYFL